MNMTYYILSQLENGKSAEDIKHIFEESLSTAQAKFDTKKKAEKEAAKKQADIDAARQELLKATAKYSSLISGEDSNQDISNLKKGLEKLENEINSTKFETEFYPKWYFNSDYETLKNFLKLFN